MREQTTRLEGLPQQAQQPVSRKVASQVAQAPTDSVPNYIPQMNDPDVAGLINGLSVLQPTLQKYSDEAYKKTTEEATLDAAAGRGPQKDSWGYNSVYFATDGMVKAQADGQALIGKYQTEFDKDKGDLEKWLAENYQGRLKNVDDEHYLSGYTKGILPAIQDIRKAHAEYQRGAVVDRVESNVQQMVIDGVKQYLNDPKGTSLVPVKDPGTGAETTPPAMSYIQDVQAKVGKTLGVSDQRFQELLFNAVKLQGDEGHFDAYELLKKPRPDGSPGIAFDPKWTEKIEQAQLHSFTVSTTRAEAQRKQLYNNALYDVFAEEDPTKAQDKFKELKQSGLFKGDAEGLIKWEKNLTEQIDGKPNVPQLDNEGKLLSKIYKGSMGYEDVLLAERNHDITSSQRKYLMGEIRKVSVENRQLAAQEGKASEQIFKSKHFTSGMDYIEEVLKPTKGPFSEPDPFEFSNRAEAKREFVELAQGKKPEELRDIADIVSKRYLKRREDASKGGLTQEQRRAAMLDATPFKTLPELIEAQKKGLVSTSDYARYRVLLKKGYPQ